MTHPVTGAASNPVFLYCQLAEDVIADASVKFEADDYARSLAESDVRVARNQVRSEELRAPGEAAIAAGVRADISFLEMERRVEAVRLSCMKLLQWRPAHRQLFYGQPPQPAEAVLSPQRIEQLRSDSRRELERLISETRRCVEALRRVAVIVPERPVTIAGAGDHASRVSPPTDPMNAAAAEPAPTIRERQDLPVAAEKSHLPAQTLAAGGPEPSAGVSAELTAAERDAPNADLGQVTAKLSAWLDTFSGPRPDWVAVSKAYDDVLNALGGRDKPTVEEAIVGNAGIPVGVQSELIQLLFEDYAHVRRAGLPNGGRAGDPIVILHFKARLLHVIGLLAPSAPADRSGAVPNSGVAKPDGPFEPNGFRFRGSEVDWGKSVLRKKLTLALWDEKNRRVGPPRKTQEVIEEVYGSDEETPESTFRGLISDTRGTYQKWQVPLDIKNVHGQIWLVELPG